MCLDRHTRQRTNKLPRLRLLAAMFGAKVSNPHCEGDGSHACELKQRRHGELTNSHLATPAIKMIIGDWHVDELGIRTREITARD